MKRPSFSNIPKEIKRTATPGKKPVPGGRGSASRKPHKAINAPLNRCKKGDRCRKKALLGLVNFSNRLVTAMAMAKVFCNPAEEIERCKRKEGNQSPFLSANLTPLKRITRPNKFDRPGKGIIKRKGREKIRVISGRARGPMRVTSSSKVIDSLALVCKANWRNSSDSLLTSRDQQAQSAVCL